MQRIIFIIIALAWFLPAWAASATYNIIIDAGSTGSRLHIFEVTADNNLPQVKDIFSKKVSPGLSTFATHPQDVGAYLKPLLDDAVAYLAKNQLTSAPVETRLFATAGMRLLDKKTQVAIYKNAYTYIATNYASSLKAVAVRTITGKEEGLFDWLDVNYLSATFANNTPSLGSIDMGGASTQIAFETLKKTPVKDETILTINGKTYRVFIKSFLGLGQDEARYTMNANPAAGACYPAGSTVDAIVGMYHFADCTTDYNQVINAFDVNQNVLPISPQQVFIAYSGVYYAFNFFGVDQQPNQSVVEAQIMNVCGETWEQMKSNYTNTAESYLITECANGTYIDDLLFNSYHLRDGQLKVVNTINGSGVDWTLGAMFYYSLPRS